MKNKFLLTLIGLLLIAAFGYGIIYYTIHTIAVMLFILMIDKISTPNQNTSGKQQIVHGNVKGDMIAGNLKKQ